MPGAMVEEFVSEIVKRVSVVPVVLLRRPNRSSTLDSHQEQQQGEAREEPATRFFSIRKSSFTPSKNGNNDRRVRVKKQHNEGDCEKDTLSEATVCLLMDRFTPC
ncbi:hypothetical protein C5167_038247 [Papaver somniferum]|uniref:Uncharacterized protein n=1 Tax=Papaver somniferum TaxID=3469 RepID=A0A4Y7IB78_PAPSO|nr:hypothetical protein C5167_038247 [Papaver somniferum]